MEQHEETVAWRSATREGLHHLGDAQSEIRWARLARRVLDPDESVLAAVVCDDGYDPHRALVVTDRRIIHWGVSALLPQHVVREIPRARVTGADLVERWLSPRLVVTTSAGRNLCLAVLRRDQAQLVLEVLGDVVPG